MYAIRSYYAGFSAGAMWEDAKVGIRHLRAFEKIAVVFSMRRQPGLGADLGIVYSAMHGVGGSWVVSALREAGFSRVFPVPEQQEPDGTFPTVRFPNPEEPGAMRNNFV